MRHAFTLIELLVVISIIAVLAGMLLPAVGLVRAAAQQAKCLGQQRQCMLAVLAYANDNEAVLPPGEAQNAGSTGARLTAARNWYLSVLQADLIEGVPVASWGTDDGGWYAAKALVPAGACLWSAKMRWPNVLSCPSFKPADTTQSRTPYGQVMDWPGATYAADCSIPLARLNPSVPYLADDYAQLSASPSSSWYASQANYVNGWAASYGMVNLVHRKRAALTFIDGHAAALGRDQVVETGVWKDSITERVP